MDPKHQFAAQYMLSRAAAERRERDSILAAAVAGGSSLLNQMGQNSRGASPTPSETSSCNERMTPPPDNHSGEIQNNENSDNNNNTNGTATNLSTNYNKLDLRSQPSQQHLHQYQQVVAAAAANIVAQNQNNCNGQVNPATSAAQAVANLAAAMRQSQPMSNGNQQSPSNYQHQQMNQHAPQHHHHIQHAEALLRSQAEAALRLAVSQAAAVVASSSNEPNLNNQFRHNGMPYGNNHHHQNNQLQSQFSPDLSEALRLQEQRLEQALRLHSSELGLHQQHHQQP
jgi:hypothetical protein